MTLNDALHMLISKIETVESIDELRLAAKALSSIVIDLWEDSTSFALDQAGLDPEDLDDQALETQGIAVANALGVSYSWDENGELELPGYVVDAVICHQAYLAGIKSGNKRIDA